MIKICSCTIWSVWEYNPQEQFFASNKILIFIEHHDCRNMYTNWHSPLPGHCFLEHMNKGRTFCDTFFLCLCLRRGELFLSWRLFEWDWMWNRIFFSTIFRLACNKSESRFVWNPSDNVVIDTEARMVYCCFEVNLILYWCFQVDLILCLNVRTRWNLFLILLKWHSINWFMHV